MKRDMKIIDSGTYETPVIEYKKRIFDGNENNRRSTF